MVLAVFYYYYSYLGMPSEVLRPWSMSSQDDRLPAPAPSSTVSHAAYRASPCSKGTDGADFISMQKVYSLWAPPGLIPQVNPFLSAVEYFIFSISESTYVKKEREIQSAQLRFAKQIMQPAENLNQAVIFITTMIIALPNFYSPRPPTENVS